MSPSSPATADPSCWLVADVGGTHVRLASVAGPQRPLEDVQVLDAAVHPRLQDAITAYLRSTGRRPVAAALAVAAPVAGDQVHFTNRDWSFSASALRQALGLARLEVLNDFEALALTLPHLTAADLVDLGGGLGQAGAPTGVVGPGTGLGVSGLLQGPDGEALALCGEGGHVTLAAHTEAEWQVLQHLRQRFGHVSAERVLCGQGLVDLCASLAALEGRGCNGLERPEQISEAALTHGDPLALRTLGQFSAWLGAVAGDLALTLGARGGVVIAGGIVPRWLPWFAHSEFRTRFESKGRFRRYLEAIPTRVLVAPTSPALRGAALRLGQRTARAVRAA